MSRPKRGTRGSHSERPAWDSNRVPQTEGAFVCVHCGRTVADRAPGTGQRNHCPNCMWSAHVDIRPGDRNSLCQAPMEPIALWVSEGGELRVLHRCSGCGTIKPNRLAGDDSDAVVADLIDRLVRSRPERER